MKKYLLAALMLLLLPAWHSVVWAQEAITLPGPGGIVLKAWHFRPEIPITTPTSAFAEREARPVVIALHGCGGLYATAGVRKGQLNARHQAMGEMLQAQGYHVIFPDSFRSRNVEGICSEVQRLKNGITIDLAQRRSDVLATLAWVRAQVWADPAKVALLGWSHGAQTLLAATDRQQVDVKTAGEPFKAAIAFYPGCVRAQREAYRPNTPLTLLLGADDDWTLPETCIQMAKRLQQAGDPVSLTVYEGAVHDFDNPLPGVRSRSDIPSRRKGALPGEGVKAGQNSAARDDSWQKVRDILAKAFESS